MDFVTIDFEASCLPRHGRSYPIEVGVAGPMGVQSWLIRPHASWQGWDWTDEAFGLHGISRQQLAAEGLEAAEVMGRLAKVITGRRLIADSRIDAYWWDCLAEAAGWDRSAAVEYVGSFFDEINATSGQILSAQSEADRTCPVRHRAGPDAHWLWHLLSTVEKVAAYSDVPSGQPWHPPLASASTGPGVLTW